MRAILKFCLVASVLAGLGACASAPAVAPLTTLGDMACSAQPDLTQAQVLRMGEGLHVNLQTVTRCWKPAGDQASSYVVYKLPASPEGYVLQVISEPRGVVLMSPRVFILDAQGAPLRDVANEKFMFRGRDFVTVFRARPGDGYLVVASDPASIGREVSNIVGSVQQSVMPAGPVIFNVYTGSEKNEQVIYSHNGHLVVKPEPLPKTN